MSSPAEIFEKIGANVAKNPELATSTDAVFQFDITGDDGGIWVLDLREGTTENFVTTGESDDSQVTITVTDSDWAGIVDGSINPMQAFMMGKIKVKGDMSLAMKLQNIMKLA